MTTAAIQTERLELIPMTLKQLRLGLTDPEQLGRELSLAIAKDVIAAEVDKANIASIRILEKVGMSIYKETNNNLYLRITRDVANIKRPLHQ